MIKEQMENIYRNIPLDKIPWNTEKIPDLLAEFVAENAAIPSKIVELGCGVGNYVIHFAKSGHDTTGIDISETAVGIAEKTALEKSLECRFFASDVTCGFQGVGEPFDLAYDWELLHHIFPEHREKYIRNVHRLLKPGGKYLSVYFSELSPQFGGEGKYRRTPIDTELYFSAEDEMTPIYEPLFEIEDLKTVIIDGKYAPHKAVYASLVKK